jgi:hypothetical protein
MGNPKGDEIVKQVGANLESWYKRNGSRLKLMDALTLDCEVCKTKEAKELIRKEIDTTLKNIRRGRQAQQAEQRTVQGCGAEKQTCKKPRRPWTRSSPF